MTPFSCPPPRPVPPASALPSEPPQAWTCPALATRVPHATVPAGHLVCDPQGHIGWTDDLAAGLLAEGRVVQRLPDGRLAARHHPLGMLALRSAMRHAVLGAPALPVVLRQGPHQLCVGVHALPAAADGSARVLLSLQPHPRSGTEPQIRPRPQPPDAATPMPLPFPTLSTPTAE
jgi:hypothetical protein